MYIKKQKIRNGRVFPFLDGEKEGEEHVFWGERGWGEREIGGELVQNMEVASSKLRA